MLHREPIGHAAPGRPEVLRLERNGRACVAKQAEPNHPVLIREEAALRLRIVAACEQFVELQADRWPAWTEMAAATAAECRTKWSDCELLPY